MTVLSQLIAELGAGTLKIVDLTQPLGAATPVIGLPPMFASSPGVSLEAISHYDDQGPAWYWNTIRMGEHTGTHFDAPVHWITGSDLPDNACDTIPARRFVGPACVIDVTADVERNPDFLLMPSHIVAWERAHARDPGRGLGAAAHWLEPAVRSGCISQRRRGRTAQPWIPQERIGTAGPRARHPRRRRRDGRHGRGAGRHVRPSISQSHDHARRREVRPGQPDAISTSFRLPVRS